VRLVTNQQQLVVDWKPTLPPDTDLGIGVIGAGFVAMDYHLPGYAAAGLRVAAVADLKEEAARAAAERFDIPHAFTDYQRMLELPEVDIVDVLTPRQGRLEIIEDVAAAGKHIMSQKPLSTTYAEGAAMVEAAEAAGVKLGVHLHYHWLPNYRAAWKLLRDGAIGEPLLLSHRMVGDQNVTYWNDPIRRWNASLDDFLLVEWGAHQLDFLRFWADQAPVRIFASTTRAADQNFESDMLGVLTVEFERGARGALLMTQVSRGADGMMDFRIEGSAGVIAGDEFVNLSVGRAGEGLTPVTLDIPDEWMEMVNLTYVGTMSELLWALAEDQDPTNSARDNLTSVAMCEAAVRSALEGRAVTIAEIEGR
jgi:predicted dehydrogenase